MRLLKGESSHWINKNQLCRGKFHWQDEYFAVSVSESLLPNVRKYIDSKRRSITEAVLFTWSLMISFFATVVSNAVWAKARGTYLMLLSTS